MLPFWNSIHWSFRKSFIKTKSMHKTYNLYLFQNLTLFLQLSQHLRKPVELHLKVDIEWKNLEKIQIKQNKGKSHIDHSPRILLNKLYIYIYYGRRPEPYILLKSKFVINHLLIKKDIRKLITTWFLILT